MSKQVNSEAETCAKAMCGGREGLFWCQISFFPKGRTQVALFLNVE